MSTTEAQCGDTSARICVEELAKGRGVEGITSDEAEQLLDLLHQTATISCWRGDIISIGKRLGRSRGGAAAGTGVVSKAQSR